MLPPLAPMPMIPGHSQGVVGEGSGSLGQLVEGSLHGVECLPFLTNPLQVASSLIPLHVFEGGDDLGVEPATHALRCDPTAPPDGSVEVRSAILVDERHCNYAFLRAPLKASIRWMSLSSSCSCWSSSKAAWV